MKLIALIILAASLTGCGKIQKYELNNATEVCGKYEDINYFEYFIGISMVRCTDGKFKRIDQ